MVNTWNYMKTATIHSKISWNRTRLELRRLTAYLMHVRRKLASSTAYLDDKAWRWFYAKIWRDAAREFSADVVEVLDGFMEIRLGSTSTLVRNHMIMIDHPLTLELTRNRPLAFHLMQARDVRVPMHQVFNFHDSDPALQFLVQTEGACVIKPAYGSAGGEGVTTGIRSRRDFYRALVRASLYCRTLLIEQQIPGDSYRLLYLNGECIDAIRRRPPTVIGDGRSTIQTLIERENERRSSQLGIDSLTRISIDLDCRLTLRSVGLSLRSIPDVGEVVRVKTTSNQNSSRDNESIRNRMCESIINEGARAAKALNVVLAGVDIITQDPTLPLRETGGVVNEVNAAPGLHFHYQTCNPEFQIPVAVPILGYVLGRTKENTLIGYDYEQTS
jgi:D-alanine-D-alanine ligase-like ATP-grasp enzyme